MHTGWRWGKLRQENCHTVLRNFSFPPLPRPLLFFEAPHKLKKNQEMENEVESTYFNTNFVEA
jgi:hypothetical protein